MKRLIPCLFALLPIATLIGNAQIVGGVELDYDPAMVFTVEAGTTLQFELTARDSTGNPIGNWDTIGHNAVLAVHGTVAETDTSHHAWSADPLGYSWLELRLNGTVLALDSVGRDQGLYYTLPPSAFTLGKAALTFTLTCAGKDITLTVTPTFGNLGQKSPPITIVPAPHDNYLIDVTWPLSNKEKVFLLRLYEIVVTPRDRYLNTISGEIIRTSFTAHFPHEFERAKAGVTDIFAAPLNVNGSTPFFVMSRIRRLDADGDDRQIIMANKAGNDAIRGWSDPFEILDHAPNPFALQKPVDLSTLVLTRASDTETFIWVKSLPQDPYTSVQISRFNPATCSDIVKYDVTFIDSPSLTRQVTYPSDSNGLAASLTMTHGHLAFIIDQLSGTPTTIEQAVVWYVTARDFDGCANPGDAPLYQTLSAPPYLDPQNRPGYRLMLVKGTTGAHPPLRVQAFALHQNYPNPFSPSTLIRIDLPSPAHCRLQVYNLVGEEVAKLHEGRLDAGTYHFQFRGEGLPPGAYSYRLEVDGAIHARSMLLVR